MKCKHNYDKLLFLIFLFCLVSLITIQNYFKQAVPRKDINQMYAAVELAEHWLKLVEQIKIEKNPNFLFKSNQKFYGLIGQEYSEITTTLGSLQAKIISLNPYFAALTVYFLNQAGVDSSKKVGIILSGSFPGIAISVLAALQVMNIDAVITSSLGASSFGANEPEATWIDIEHWLNLYGNMRYKSSFVTYGAEGDTGGGLSNAGIEIIKTAINRTHRELFIPKSLKESIDKHIKLLDDHNVDLLINIGGTHASLGNCMHSTSIPNGYVSRVRSCNDTLRGILIKFSEKNKPFIHFLNIKDLAVKNKIPFDYNPEIKIPSSLYYIQKYDKIPIFISILIIYLLLFIFFNKRL